MNERIDQRPGVTGDADFERIFRSDLRRAVVNVDVPSGLADRLVATVERAPSAARRTSPVPGPSTGRSERRRSSMDRWLWPLVAAAAVLLIVVVTVAARVGQGPTQPAGPTGSVTSVTTPATASQGGPVPGSPTGTPSAPTTGATGSGSAAGATPVGFGGATWVIPAGWTASEVTCSGQSCLAAPSLCLVPSGGTPSVSNCVIQVLPVPGDQTDTLNPDIEGGFDANPQWCDPASGATTGGLVTASDAAIGARAADYRLWHYRCATGETTAIEQYVVMTGPAFVVYTAAAAGPAHQAMAALVSASTLPAAQTALRFEDVGYLRSVTPVAGGRRITVDRVVLDPGKPAGVRNENPATYTYTVPSSLAGPLTVGSLVRVRTDGTAVTAIEPLG